MKVSLLEPVTRPSDKICDDCRQEKGRSTQKKTDGVAVAQSSSESREELVEAEPNNHCCERQTVYGKAGRMSMRVNCLKLKTRSLTP